MATRPSMMMSVATVALKVSPGWVVALSSVWVMRIGRVLPAGMVTVLKAGGGGGGGGAATGAATGGAAGASWRSMGAGGGGVPYCATSCRGVSAEGLLLKLLAGDGGGAGIGAGASVLACSEGLTDKLLITVRTPATWAASSAARARAASLLTSPVRVATPF